MAAFGQTVTPLALLKEVTLQTHSAGWPRGLRLALIIPKKGQFWSVDGWYKLLPSICGSDNPISISHTILSAVLTLCWFASTSVFVIFSSLPPHNILGYVPHTVQIITLTYTPAPVFKYQRKYASILIPIGKQHSATGKTHTFFKACEKIRVWVFQLNATVYTLTFSLKSETKQLEISW